MNPINAYSMNASQLAFAIAALGHNIDKEMSESLFAALENLIGYDEAHAAIADARQIVANANY